MNTNLNKTLLSSLIILSISACGGGGGDGDDARNMSGIWRGTLTKVSDSCTPAGPASITVNHQVNQNEDAIILKSEAGVDFLGNTVGQDGFSVDGSHATVGNSGCNDQTRIEYESIDDDDDPTADIVVKINRSCTNTSGCALEYSGTVSRTQGLSPTPVSSSTPLPGTPTPIVIAGGCKDMNPKTVAGGFSGNGGCGISQTNFSTQGNAVVLEPFGSNGLTTFNIDSSNSALANSQRQDLTILSVDGNQCSITCSPPSTFTVRCQKEGGSSCIEKF